MSVRSRLEHQLGVDFVRSRMDEERVYLQELTGNEDPYPFQAGVSTAAHIYAERAKTILGTPVIILSRLISPLDNE